MMDRIEIGNLDKPFRLVRTDLIGSRGGGTHMADKITSETPKSDAPSTPAKAKDELSDAQLDKVSGGSNEDPCAGGKVHSR